MTCDCCTPKRTNKISATLWVWAIVIGALGLAAGTVTVMGVGVFLAELALIVKGVFHR